MQTTLHQDTRPHLYGARAMRSNDTLMVAPVDRAEVQVGAVPGRRAAADPEDRLDAGRTGSRSVRRPPVVAPAT